MAYGTVSADVIQSSVANTSLGAGNASIMKNRIINGAMVIDQRNAGASVTQDTSGTQYTLDRWLIYGTQASKFTVQQNAGSVTPPVGFTNYLGATSSAATSLGAGDYFTIQQRIEGYNVADLNFGSANAKTITVSFWVRSSLTGSFGGALANSAFDRSYPFTYTISSANTWEQKSITIAGDTSGTWLTTNGNGLRIVFSLGAGSTYSGTANAWTGSTILAPTGSTSVVGTNGATFYITGVQLEVGSSATGFEYRQYGQEYALCQRYFEKSFNDGVAPANGVGNTFKFIASAINSSTGYVNCGVFCAEKRAAPTMTFYRTDNGSSNGQPAYYSGGWNNGTSISPSTSTRSFQFNYGGSFTSTNAYLTDVQWTASAEL